MVKDIYTDKEALSLAKKLVSQHLSGKDNWKVKLSKSKRSGGSCSWHTKTIRISRMSINCFSKRGLERIILHEIAHALCNYEDPRHNHLSLSFKRICNALGTYANAKIHAEYKMDRDLAKELYKNYYECSCGNYYANDTRNPYDGYVCRYCSKVMENSNV